MKIYGMAEKNEDLKNAEEDLNSDLSHLTNSFYFNYCPTKETLKKHDILRHLRSTLFV